MNQLTEQEVIELVNSNKRLHIKLANAVVENKLLLEQLQEKSQGEAVAIKAIPFATVRWQESLPDVMGNRKREAYIQEIYPAIYPEHGTTLYRLDGIKQNSLLVDRKSLELCLHPAPPQPQTVKDMLEKAVANIKQCRQPIVYPDENQVSISCYHEGLDKACQVIRALIDQPAEQPAQSNEPTKHMLTVAHQHFDDMGINIDSDQIAVIYKVMLSASLQSKPTKGVLK